MKRKKMLLATTAGLVWLAPMIGYGLTVNPSRAEVTVEFVAMDQLTDIQQGSVPFGRLDSVVLEEIEKQFRDTAQKYLPAEYSLQVRVTDIDLAGDREPWPPVNGEYRIMRDIYPPRINFEYSIMDANERIVAAGSETLRDINYQQNFKATYFDLNKTAPYVSDLVAIWIKGKMRRVIDS